MEHQFEDSILARVANPIHLALAVMALSVTTMIGSFLLSSLNIISISKEFYWIISASYTLLFIMFNSMLIIASEHMEKFYRNSLYTYFGLVALSIGLAYLFSGIPIGEAGSFKWIFLVLTIAFIALLSIGSAIKRIAMAANREEERLNQK